MHLHNSSFQVGFGNHPGATHVFATLKGCGIILYHILAVCLSQTAGTHKILALGYKKSGRYCLRKSKLEKLHFQLKNQIMYNIFSHCYGTKMTIIAELLAWRKPDEALGLIPPLSFSSRVSNMIYHILQFYITAILPTKKYGDI